MSYYAPSANKLMQLGPINWTTNKWIDLTVNGNDADLVDGYCARFNGSSQWLEKANFVNPTLHIWKISFITNINDSIRTFIIHRDGVSHCGLRIDAAGKLLYTLAGIALDAGISVLTATKYTVVCYYDGTNMGISVNGAAWVTTPRAAPVYTNTATLRIGRDFSTWTGNYFSGDIWDVRIATYTAANLTAIENDTLAANSYLAWWNLASNVFDRSGNGNTLTNNGSTVLQATQPYYHSNLRYGCDIYTKNGDATNRALWYYNPYKADGTPAATAAQVATAAGYAVTLLRSCLPYRADAPLNLSETKIQFKSTLPMDIMNKAPASISWAACYGAASCVHVVSGVEYIYKISGYTGGGTYTNKVSRTKDKGVHWEDVTTSGATLPAVTDGVAYSIGGKIFFYGGIDATSTAQKRIYSSTDGIAWTDEGDSACGLRYSHRAVVMNGKVYIMGGYLSGTLTNDLWYSSDGVNFTNTSLAGAKYTARSYFCAESINNRIYVMGGYDNVATVITVYSWAVGENAWTLEANLPVANGTGKSSTSYNNVIYIGGGWVVGGANDHEIYSFNGTTWTLKTAAAAWSVRRSASMTALSSGELVLFSGNDGTNPIQDCYFSLDLGATWITAEIYDPAKMSGTAFYDGTSDATKHTHYQEELNGKFRNGATRDAFKGYSFFGSYAEEVDASLYGLKGRYRAGIIYSAKQIGAALRNINKFCHGENY